MNNKKIFILSIVGIALLATAVFLSYKVDFGRVLSDIFSS